MLTERPALEAATAPAIIAGLVRSVHFIPAFLSVVLGGLLLAGEAIILARTYGVRGHAQLLSSLAVLGSAGTPAASAFAVGFGGFLGCLVALQGQRVSP